MEHIIRQQYLHVEMHGTEGDALALQRRLPAWCQHELLPALTRVFDQCAPPQMHLCLDRLEINVGALSLERMEQDWAEAMAQAIEKSLREHGGEAQHKSTTQTLHEAFAHFLNTGRLPWSWRMPAGEHLEQLLLRTWSEPTPVATPTLKSVLLPALASATARARLLRQFSAEFHAALLARLAPEAKAALDAIFQTLRADDVPTVEIQAITLPLYASAFAALATGRALPAASFVSEARPTLPATKARKAINALERRWPVSNKPTAKPQSVPTLRPNDAATEIRPSTQPRNLARPLFEGQDEVRDGLYLDCAGLVLLHPFLPRFFTALGIAVNDELVQPERALCLLHYLATGQQVAPEYELILPKILCNVPLETPVASQVEFTTAELEEAEALLNAVIRHWEALGDSSMDGLRGTFLVRAGKVSLRDDGDWWLQVEAQGFDILLDQLPWGIGMIQLPWMPKMLWVEWQ